MQGEEEIMSQNDCQLTGIKKRCTKCKKDLGIIYFTPSLVKGE